MSVHVLIAVLSVAAVLGVVSLVGLLSLLSRREEAPPAHQKSRPGSQIDAQPRNDSPPGPGTLERATQLLTPRELEVFEELEAIIRRPLVPGTVGAPIDLAAAAGLPGGRLGIPQGEDPERWGCIFIHIPLERVVRSDKRPWASGRGSSSGPTIDFLICESGTLRPLAAILLQNDQAEEADDPDRAGKTDACIARILDEAGLPLVSWRTDPACDMAEAVMEAVERGVLG